MLDGLVAEGGVVPASLLGGPALLPRVPTELCCRGSACRVLTSTSAAPGSIFVSCLCADCTLRRPDLLHRDGGNVLSLDQWIEHVSGEPCGAGDLATALDLVAVRQQATTAEDAPLVPLRSWLRAASAHMGGAALMRRQVSIYWFSIDSDDNDPGLPPPPSQRQAAAAVEAAAGPKQPSGAWRAASVVSYDSNTTVWTIKYHTDSKRHHSTVLLPLCGVHFSRTPPAPGAQLRSMPEGVPPMPAVLPALRSPLLLPSHVFAVGPADPAAMPPAVLPLLPVPPVPPVPLLVQEPVQVQAGRVQQQQAQEAHHAEYGWLQQQQQQQPYEQQQQELHILQMAAVDASDALSEAGPQRWAAAGDVHASHGLPPAAGGAAVGAAAAEACAAAVAVAHYTAAAITAAVSPPPWPASEPLPLVQHATPPPPEERVPTVQVPLLQLQQPQLPQQTVADALVWSTTEALRQAPLLSAVSIRPAHHPLLSSAADGRGGTGVGSVAPDAKPAAALATAATAPPVYYAGGAPVMLPSSTPTPILPAPQQQQLLTQQAGAVGGSTFGGMWTTAAAAAPPGLPPAPGLVAFGGGLGGASVASAPESGQPGTATAVNLSALPAFAQSSPALLVSTAAPAAMAADAPTPCGPVSSWDADFGLDALRLLGPASVDAAAAAAEAGGTSGGQMEALLADAETLRAAAFGTSEAAVVAGAAAGAGGAAAAAGPDAAVQVAPFMGLRPASRNSSSSSSNNNGQQQLLAAHLFAPLPAFVPELHQLPAAHQEQAHPAHPLQQQQRSEPRSLPPQQQQQTVWQQLQQMQEGSAAAPPPWAAMPPAAAPMQQQPFVSFGAGGFAGGLVHQPPASASWLAAATLSPQPRPQHQQQERQWPQPTLARLPSTASALVGDVSIPPAVRPRTASYTAGTGMPRAASFNVLLVEAATAEGIAGTAAAAAGGAAAVGVGIRAARTKYNNSGAAMAPALAPLAAHLRSPQRPRLMAAGRGAVRPVASSDHGGPAPAIMTTAAAPSTSWGGGAGIAGDQQADGAAGNAGLQQHGAGGGGGGGVFVAAAPPDAASSDHGSAGRIAAAAPEPAGSSGGGAGGSFGGLSILTTQWAQEAAAAAAAAATAAAVAALAADVGVGGGNDAGMSMYERMHAVASAAAAAATTATRRTEDGGGGTTSEGGAAAAAAAAPSSARGSAAVHSHSVVPPVVSQRAEGSGVGPAAAAAVSPISKLPATYVRMSASVRPDIGRQQPAGWTEQDLEAAAAVARWSAPACSIDRYRTDGEATAAADDIATAAAAAAASSALALGSAGVAGGRLSVRMRSMSGGGRRSRSLRAASPSQQQSGMLGGPQAVAAARSSAGTAAGDHDGDTRSSLATVIDGESDDEADELLQQLLQQPQRTSTGATSAGRRLAGGSSGGRVAGGAAAMFAAAEPATSAVLGVARCGTFGAAGPSPAAGGGVDSSSRRSGGALLSAAAEQGQQAAEGLLGKRTRLDLGSGPHGSAAASSTALHMSLGAAPALLFATAAAPLSTVGAGSMMSSASAACQFPHQQAHMPPQQQQQQQQRQHPALHQQLPTLPNILVGSAPALPVDVQTLPAAKPGAGPAYAATAPSRMSWEGPVPSGPMGASPFSTSAAAGGGAAPEGAHPAAGVAGVEHSLYLGTAAAAPPWGGGAYGPAGPAAAPAPSASTASATAIGGSSTLWGDDSTGRLHRIQSSQEHPIVQTLHIHTSAPLPQHGILHASVAVGAPPGAAAQQQEAPLIGTAAVAAGALPRPGPGPGASSSSSPGTCNYFPVMRPRGAMSPQMSAHNPLPQTQFLVGLGGGLGSPGMGAAVSTAGGGSDGSSGGLSLTRLVPMGGPGPGLHPQQSQPQAEQQAPGSQLQQPPQPPAAIE
ncbi:hypothetical protein HXX76_006862 [Chlamydomonas incerta]|uniref:Uncharacterized protein n=1 Tax=Chlamydomonas incerta TaxID=51695 RepID=A0A835TB53_CHLIN|nr:hypothetical protein HXX76_006862 [Chlamydomonas incerta]|eukprot:KAG2435660.1 hypothetical protein HXX76_006862 [Chlamydomonas incerta]